MEDFFVLVAVLALVAIAVYFSAASSAPPTAFERVAALAWLVVRRFVCFSSSLLCVVGLGAALRAMLLNGVTINSLLGALLALPFAYIFFHWGAYGTGRLRYDYNEDLPAHEERKKRYGWRW